MINIKEEVKLPSRALELMVEGLEYQNSREGFIVDMGSYGFKGLFNNKTTCFGCAATCTIQRIANKNLEPNAIDRIKHRSEFLGIEIDELQNFESAINHARAGDLDSLFGFFGIDHYNIPYETLNPDYYLGNSHWENELPKVKKHIELLKSKGY